MTNTTATTTIFCDAAENTVTKVVNGYGKKEKFNNGGHRIGIVVVTEGEAMRRRAVHYNTQCPDQFAGECFAVLKAVEAAVEMKLESVTISNDRVGNFTETTKRGYKGATYLWLAKKMAAEAGLQVEFERVGGAENQADTLSRTEGLDSGWLTDAETLVEAIKVLEPEPKLDPQPALAKPATVATAAKVSRGTDHEEWFAAHTAEWPTLREAWKAEGLSSKERDGRLAATISEWVAAGKPVKGGK